MDDRIYHIRISPEVIKNDIFNVDLYTPYTTDELIPFCCDIITQQVTQYVTGSTMVYSSMTEILSGGTNGASILTGLTIPIFLSETCVDIGYYNVFDGFVLQKPTMTNFLFSADTTTDPFGFTYNFYNTSEKEFKKYLFFTNYYVNWGDGSPIETITTTSPSYYSHTYASPGEYVITMSGMSPWGTNIVQKTVTVPFTGITIDNPMGEAYFQPAGGSWSGTLFSYDYIFSGDSTCEAQLNDIDNFTTVPFLVTGYTKSYLSDLKVYGNRGTLFLGQYPLPGTTITGTSGILMTFWGPSEDGLYTGYTIDGINYYDYSDGTTVFAVQSSGLTSDMLVCSAITKNEVLMNVIDEAEVQSDVFIERGKNSALERIERLGEIDNLGDLEKYGYGFFNVIKF